MKRVFFLCTGNSCRSQIAEAIVSARLSGEWQAFSAGTKPAGYVHPNAVCALAEIGIKHEGRSKSVDEFRGQAFDVVVTVCDSAAEECPVWLGKGRRAHLSFPDPALATGSDDEVMAVFRAVRDDMLRLIPDLLAAQSTTTSVGSGQSKARTISSARPWPRETKVGKIKVLFLCTSNSARSQMAEAFLRRYAGDHFEVSSAGLEPRAIHPYTLRVMQETGYGLQGHYSKDVAQFLFRQHFGYVITVCSRAEANCPIFPGVVARLSWPFDDPAAFQGNDEEMLAKFREVRDQIDWQVRAWVGEMGFVVNEAAVDLPAQD